MSTAAWRIRIAAALAVSALTWVPSALAAEESAPATEAAPATPPEASAEPEKPKIDVRKLFAMNCSWCHDGYGLHAGKGPKLAGTKMTAEQVYQRIAKGKSGAMPGFEKTLKKEQIEAFVEYIRGLKDPDS
ncbi:MAG: cytochrome c [Burkholderiales bacterium]|nr:cytochrome c [Burkholderiales bacterium]